MQLNAPAHKYEEQKLMNGVINKAISLVATCICMILIVGIAFGTTVGAQALPEVPPEFEVGVFATVTDPMGLSLDSGGNLFVGRDASGSGGDTDDAVPIHRVSADGSTVAEFGDPIADPDAVIVDINGTVATLGSSSVLVGGLEFGTSRITQISPGGSTTSVLFSSPLGSNELRNPTQFAFDTGGRLLWTNSVGTVGISDGGAPTIFASLGDPIALAGIAVGPDGRVFVSGVDGTVRVFSSDGTLLDGAFVSGLSGAFVMALDTIGPFGGNLFIRAAGGQILRIDPNTGSTEVFATGFGASFGFLAFGPDGCLFVSDFANDTVWRTCRLSTPAPIPSLTQWGLITMAGLLAGILAWIRVSTRREGARTLGRHD